MRIYIPVSKVVFANQFGTAQIDVKQTAISRVYDSNLSKYLQRLPIQFSYIYIWSACSDLVFSESDARAPSTRAKCIKSISKGRGEQTSYFIEATHVLHRHIDVSM
jgi:hypothetical protein